MAISSQLADLSAILRGSTLVRRSSVLLAGVIGAKAIAIPALLLLARLYDTEAFGLLGLLQALVFPVLVVASLGYQLAVALPGRDDEAASVLWLSLGLLGSATLLATGTAVFFREAIARGLDAPDLTSLVFWAPALLLALGLYEVMVYWLTRRRAFARLARSRVTVSLAVAVVQITAWFLGALTGGLIVGLVLGTGLAAGLLLVQTWSGDRERLLSGLSWSRVRRAAVAYRQFPAYQAPASLLSSASLAVVPLGLGFFFGPVVVGIYWMADRVCGYLTTLVRQSMQQVFLNRAAEVANSGGDVLPLYSRTTIGLAGLALPPTAVLVLAGPFVFGLAFGDEWTEAGTYARWLSVAWLFSAMNIPAVQLAAVYHLQHWTLFYSLGLTAFRGIGVVAGGLVGDPMLVIMIYAFGNAACSSGLVLAMARHLRRPGAPRRSKPMVPVSLE
jgi:lipopolysaccharide exporter